MSSWLLLSAVVVPLAVVAVMAMARRVGEAASDLGAELAASGPVRSEGAALADDLERLARRRPQRRRFRGIQPRH